MKIAVLGSAISSAPLAPYDDPSWTIWGCSPALVPLARRTDEWFEVHAWNDVIAAGGANYVLHLGMHKGPVWMIEPRREVPASAAFPKDEMLDAFGPYFFTSSIAWMMAKAILALAASPDPEKVLGLWGIDMQANGEYGDQRPGCHHFIAEARRRGIEVFAPPESDILAPPPLYGFDAASRRDIKLASKHAEIAGRMKEQEQALRSAEARLAYFRGAKEMLEYLQRTKL